MKFSPNPYRDTRDRATMWILLGVVVFALVVGTAAICIVLAALR